ncbi:MAG TPA: DUF2851 family protein [Opitutales bacterium]|nr:DUF2851 family protein [Opitutales bacterium]
MPITAVQEVQGLYGPFSVSEKIIQKIWHRGDFYQEGLKTTAGKGLKVLGPGSWNTNEGPDFKGACLEIDGQETVGDVEIHFYPNDWFKHGHDQNPNFEKVVLHVVLYPGAVPGWEADFSMETLVLMPQLQRDLEEHVMEDALLDLEQVNELAWFERFMDRSLSERRALLEELGAARWAQKVMFAKKRLDRADWTRCCHESALEVLGFARNRGVMHKVASRFSIADFAEGLDTDSLYETFRDEWKLSGCRPANHPKLRLRQYARICAANRDWPEKLKELLAKAGDCDAAKPAEFRKLAETKQLLASVTENVFQDIIGDKRLNSLLCDAVFPLASSVLDGQWHAYWQHWYPGDYPDAFNRFYRQAGLAEARTPMSNGIMQGILALFASKGEALD